jgi:hypothetical protein
MKYNVKVILSEQQNVNANQKDKDGNPLPVQLESVVVYSQSTNITTSGSAQLTADEMKASLRTQFQMEGAISESIHAGKNEVSGSLTDNFNYHYKATSPFIAPPTGSVTGSI